MKLLKDNIVKHMKALCETIGERHLGSEGERKAIAYIARQFRENGYEVVKEPFYTAGWRYGQYSLSVPATGKSIPCFPCYYSHSCDISGKLLRIQADDIERLSEMNVQDKICFIDVPTSVGEVMGRNELAERLDRLGADVMIVVSNYADTVNTKIVRTPELERLAVIVVSGNTARDVLEDLDATYEIKVDAENFPTQSFNVVGRVTGKGKRKMVAGGHYDTAPGIQGAYDNAGGVAIVLEAARLLKGRTGDWTLDFVAFSAEEFGQHNRPAGSYAYAERHLHEMKDTVCMYDIDGVGSSICDTKVQYEGPSQLRDTINAVLSSYDLSLEKHSVNGDSIVFDDNGVATVRFRSDFESAPIHSPQDNLDIIDYDELTRVCEIVWKTMESIIKT